MVSLSWFHESQWMVNWHLYELKSVHKFSPFSMYIMLIRTWLDRFVPYQRIRINKKWIVSSMQCKESPFAYTWPWGLWEDKDRSNASKGDLSVTKKPLCKYMNVLSLLKKLGAMRAKAHWDCFEVSHHLFLQFYKKFGFVYIRWGSI